VKLSRCSRGIAVLIIVLWIYAFFFDSFPAVVAAGALSFFLITRSILFLLALRSIVAVLDPKRTVSPLIVRQGSPVTVETRVETDTPPGFTCVISDLTPHGSVITTGSSSKVVSKGQPVSPFFNYTITPLVMGNQAFRGISLLLSDQFFSASLMYGIKKATLPSITVLPLSGFVYTGRDIFSEEESRAITPLKDPSIRSFREYVPGDDLRKIDWKLSAKYDSLYVREFMGKAEHTSIFIIDLPDVTLPSDEKAFSRLKEAVVGALMRPALALHEFSVILISGPNLVSCNRIQPDLPGLSNLMKHLAPTHRLHSLYRTRSSENLRRRYSSGISDDPFGKRLHHIIFAFLSGRPPTLFEAQMDQMLRLYPASTAHLFSLADFDDSHLGLLTKQASSRKMDVILHIPRESYGQQTREKIRQSGFSSIEVF
jgi:hypothetical protein